ncbi:MAG: hypothetical protein KGZ58_04975 [Ignavibacteriales bacterium]|nr:hypothetical protein [Ignavibacteriales bacterium]
MKFRNYKLRITNYELQSVDSLLRKTIFFFLVSLLFASFSFSQIGGSAGSFARMGFGARGMGMGNALSAATTGEAATYYNPAVSPFVEGRTISATSSFLSLDRRLNFLNYTQSVAPTAGFSLGIINQSVSEIDGRDADGIHTKNYSTTENQFYFSFANRLSRKISLGINAKLYYAKLFEKLSSTTVGFDAGVLIKPNDVLSFAAVIQDFNSKYRWNTKDLYQENGGETVDTFPTLYKFGAQYFIPSARSIVSLEIETSGKNKLLMRGGIEITLNEYFTLRSGIDRYDLEDEFVGVKPTFGFSVQPLSDLKTFVHYAYIFEPFSPRDAHILSVSFSF